MAAVLGMTPSDTPTVYGLALSGYMIDVSDTDFWTRKDCRSLDAIRRRYEEGSYFLQSSLPPSRSQSPETRQLSSELALLKEVNYQVHKGNFLDDSLSKYNTERAFQELKGGTQAPAVNTPRPRPLSRAVVSAIENETDVVISELRAAAVRALKESHGSAVASMLDVCESLPPTPTQKKRNDLNDDGTPKTVEQANSVMQ
jgi:hypothetical protein